MYNDRPQRDSRDSRDSRDNRDSRDSRDRRRDGEGGSARRGTPLSELDPALTDVSRKVIGAAIDVHMALGPGFSDEVYLQALGKDLDSLGVKFKAHHRFDVKYKGQVVGERVADLYIDDRFLVDVMAEHKEIGSVERAALRALLRAADLELGLILNFAEMRLKDGLVRVLNPDKLNAMKGVAAGTAAGSFSDEEPGTYDPDLKA